MGNYSLRVDMINLTNSHVWNAIVEKWFCDIPISDLTMTVNGDKHVTYLRIKFIYSVTLITLRAQKPVNAYFVTAIR